MSRKHVLVVDASPSMRAVVRIGLEEFGFEVHECTELNMANQLITELEPEAMVVGLNLPPEDVASIVGEWRGGLSRQVLVVALVEGETLPDTTPPGIRWLLKPFGLTSLLAALYQSLGIRMA